MNSKTSLFNKAVYKTNIKRYGFIFAIYFFITEVLIDFFYLGNTTIVSKDPSSSKVLDFLYYPIDDMGFYYLFTVTIVSVLMAMVLFAYIRNEKALTILHAMPVSRKSLYFSNYAVFGSLMAVTMAIHFIFVSIHMIIKGVPVTLVLGVMGMRFIMLMLLAMTVFAFTTFIGMLVSHFILQGALVMMFFGLPFMLYELFMVLLSMIVIGYDMNFSTDKLDMRLTPYYFLSDISFLYKDMFSGFNEKFNLFHFRIATLSIVLSLVMLVASLVFGYILYQKRDLEKCNEFFAFDMAKHLITFIVVTLLSLILASIAGALSMDISNSKLGIYIGAFIGVLIAYVVMKLIAEKSVQFWKFIPRGLIFGSLLCLILFVVDLDVIGYEKWTPARDEIEYAYIYSGSMPLSMIEREHGFSSENMDSRYSWTPLIAKLSGEDLDEVFEMQVRAVDIERGALDVEMYSRDSLGIKYILKSGKVVERNYELSEMEVEDMLRECRNMSSNIEALSDDFDAKMAEFAYQEIGIGGISSSVFDIKGDEIAGFLAAVKKDYINDVLGDVGEGKSMLLAVYAYSPSNGYDELKVMSNYDNTIAWLKTNGYADAFDDDVAKVERVSESELPSEIYVYKLYAKGDEDLLFIMRDRSMISRCLEIDWGEEAENREGDFVLRLDYYRPDNGGYITHFVREDMVDILFAVMDER